MRNLVATITAASLLCFGTVDMSSALPLAAPGANAASSARSDVQDTRLYCFNRYSGEFLHWGSCGGYRRAYRRTYCRNTYTGQFLHWGACW